MEPGTRLGHFEIIKPLGAGGMGEVYRARDTTLDRDVAIKVLPGAISGDPERIARFKREARTLASLDHPGIVTIYSVEDSAALPFITILGFQIPALLTSSAIIENLFSLPGMGRYIVTAASQLDYPVVMTVTMCFSIIILSTQLLVDLSYAFLDPRVSYKKGG